MTIKIFCFVIRVRIRVRMLCSTKVVILYKILIEQELFGITVSSRVMFLFLICMSTQQLDKIKKLLTTGVTYKRLLMHIKPGLTIIFPHKNSKMIVFFIEVIHFVAIKYLTTLQSYFLSEACRKDRILRYRGVL